MAQSVEHVIGNDEVISSILITSSKTVNFVRNLPFLFFLFVGYDCGRSKPLAYCYNKYKSNPRHVLSHAAGLNVLILQQYLRSYWEQRSL